MKRTPQEVANFLGKYIAQDGDGKWFQYDVEPEYADLDDECWLVAPHCLYSRLTFVSIDYVGTWMDSLTLPKEIIIR